MLKGARAAKRPCIHKSGDAIEHWMSSPVMAPDHVRRTSRVWDGLWVGEGWEQAPNERRAGGL